MTKIEIQSFLDSEYNQDTFEDNTSIYAQILRNSIKHLNPLNNENTQNQIEKLIIKTIKKNNIITKDDIVSYALEMLDELNEHQIQEVLQKTITNSYNSITTLQLQQWIKIATDKKNSELAKQAKQEILNDGKAEGTLVSHEVIQNEIHNQIKENNYLLLKDQNTAKYIIRSIYGVDDIQVEHSTRDSIVSFLNDKIAKPNEYDMEIRRNTPQGYIQDIMPLNYKAADLTVATNVKRIFKPETTAVLINQKHNMVDYNEFLITEELNHKNENINHEESASKCPYFIGVLNNLVENNPQHLDWLINWLSSNYQLRTKSEKSVIFLGVSGSGKGLLGKVLKNIYSDYFTLDENGRLLDSHFNSALYKKLYYFLDEMEDKDSKHNILKAYTAQNATFSLTNKGVDSREAELTANFVIASNEENPIKMAEGYDDRRFNVFRATNSLRNMTTEFGGKNQYQIYNEVMDELPFIIEMFANYNIKDDEYRNKQLQTNEWIRLAEESKSSQTLFFENLYSFNLDYFDGIGAGAMFIKSNETKLNMLDLIRDCMLQGKIPSKFIRSIFLTLYDGETYKPLLSKRDTYNGQSFKPAANVVFREDVFNNIESKETIKCIKFNAYIDKEAFNDLLIKSDIPLKQAEKEYNERLQS